MELLRYIFLYTRSAMETKPETRHPLLSLRPRFEMTIFLLEATPIIFAGTIGLTLIGGTFLFILFSLTGLSKFIPAPSIYMTLLILSLALIPPFFYEIKRRAFQRTVWHFYPNHLEFQFFRYYLIRERGRLRYNDIDNVVQRAGALQERLGLTTLFLLSRSAGHFIRNGQPGVKISDIPDTNAVGRRILDLIDQSLNPVSPAPVSEPAAHVAGAS